MTTTTALPQKRREIQHDMMDSTRWNEFSYHPDDIIIASWGKSGTTWVQQIVAQLIFDGRDVPVGDISPWLEFPMFGKDEVLSELAAQTHRRFIKTHLPVDALGIRPNIKYIYVARDGRDCAFSMHSFASGFDGTPRILPDGTSFSRPQPNADQRQFFLEWLEGQADILSPFFPNVQGWWDIRNLPNVLLVHYNNLKTDMAAEIQGIADFLAIKPSAAAWPTILDHCGFDYMKRNSEIIGPKGAKSLKGGSTAFFYKGSNGRWREILTFDDIKRYEEVAAEKLTADCAAWLATGKLPSN